MTRFKDALDLLNLCKLIHEIHSTVAVEIRRRRNGDFRAGSDWCATHRWFFVIHAARAIGEELECWEIVLVNFHGILFYEFSVGG